MSWKTPKLYKNKGRSHSMEPKVAKTYYSRPEIQQALLRFAKEREIGVMFDGYFGKRPDVLENIYDIKKVVEKGVFSFHCSEERWTNPLLLGTEKNEEDRNKNRSGWDLILDLDGKAFEYSKIIGKIILDFLGELHIKSVSVKFSGNKGFHIAVPFEAFSSQIIGLGETRTFFPEAARKIASYIVYELRGKFSKALLEYEGSLEHIAEKYSIPIKDLICDDKDSLNFDYMKIIEVDTILISSRHLFRMPYSLNEKSGLASIPVKKEHLEHFERFLAKPEKVDPSKYGDFEFLAYKEEWGKDADVLLLKAYEDDYSDMISQSIHTLAKRNAEFVYEINEEVEMKDFPKTILYILDHNFEDGKKRALFVLLCYLYGIKWKSDTVKQLIEEWNGKQENALKQTYVRAQVTWFENSSKSIIPNYDNENYYKNIGIPEDVLVKDKKKFLKREMKNPLHYTHTFLAKKNSEKK